MALYHRFDGETESSTFLSWKKVNTYQNLLGLPNAEEALAAMLPKEFQDAANKHGWNLKDALEEAVADYTNLTSTATELGKAKEFVTRVRMASMFFPDSPAIEMVDQAIAFLIEKKEAITAKLLEVEAKGRKDNKLQFRMTT
jgi:hypothetical protein